MKYSDNKLVKLETKLDNEERISAAEALDLFETKDILGLGYLADKLRQKRAGDAVTFVGNYHICYSNICVHHCRYCTFRRNQQDPDAFILDLPTIEKAAKESKKSQCPEILILGGIHPGLDLEFALKVLKGIKRQVPQVKILGFSPVEIDHFCRLENMEEELVFSILKEAGLSAITGGGAEIFSPRIREQLGCTHKISGQRWLQIMEVAHRQGIFSNASLLYGVGETITERIEHLQAVREVQDRTGGFTHFLPFSCTLEHLPHTSGYDDIKMIAVSRIFLDNFKHIRAYWSHLGLPGAQLALSFGADDLNGLRQKGRIIHSSGGGTLKITDKETMIGLIRDAGRIPVERDILFNVIERYE
ncbi:MAG: CofH family radical SAM protein [Candidatus Schekmanbacteria bacterium]|nr:CofH family radical SAM protein [Candidatus Schekmanbacteria bacterium]